MRYKDNYWLDAKSLDNVSLLQGRWRYIPSNIFMGFLKYIYFIDISGDACYNYQWGIKSKFRIEQRVGNNAVYTAFIYSEKRYQVVYKINDNLLIGKTVCDGKIVAFFMLERITNESRMDKKQEERDDGKVGMSSFSV
jgi:hypothetical protein